MGTDGGVLEGTDETGLEFGHFENDLPLEGIDLTWFEFFGGLEATDGSFLENAWLEETDELVSEETDVIVSDFEYLEGIDASLLLVEVAALI